jgi:2TM domain-containing protein
MRGPGCRARRIGTDPAVRRTTAARTFRIHAVAFVAGVIGLATADYLISKSWWSLWPIVLWSVAFAAHYFFRKARSVDENWAQERAADLHSKSYDASHMDSIAKRYDEKTPEPPEESK